MRPGAQNDLERVGESRRLFGAAGAPGDVLVGAYQQGSGLLQFTEFAPGVEVRSVDTDPHGRDRDIGFAEGLGPCLLYTSDAADE